MINPLVDISTLIGVDSLFKQDAVDPWGPTLAGRLADLYIYSDQLRYVLPMPGWMEPSKYPGTPTLLQELRNTESGLLAPVVFDTEHVPVLQDEYLFSTFEAFLTWTRNNPKRLLSWTTLHSQQWVREGSNLRAQRKYVFDERRLKGKFDVNQAAQTLKVATPELLLYTYDIVLRYPLYGALAGENSHFINHPIRNAFPLPGMSQQTATVAPICVSFEKTVTEMAPKLSSDQYIHLLVDLRRAVRERGIHTLRPGQVELGEIRDLAQTVKLTPYLKDIAKYGTVAGEVIAGLGLFPVFGPASTLLGISVALMTTLWSGELWRAVARPKWLQWAVRYQIEEEVE